MQQLEQLREEHGSSPHEDVAACLMLIGEAHLSGGVHEKAVAAHQLSLKMKHELSPDAPSYQLARGYLALGDALSSFGRIDSHSTPSLEVFSVLRPSEQSLEAYRKSVTLFSAVCQSSPDPLHATAEQRLAAAHLQVAKATAGGDAAQERLAIMHFEAALAILLDLHGDTPTVELARLLQCLGGCYLTTTLPGLRHKGLELLRKAHAAYLATLGPEHPATRSAAHAVDSYTEDPSSSSGCLVL